MTHQQISFVKGMTPSDVHPVDVLLTNVGIRYQQEDRSFVHPRVFPIVPVDRQSNRYATWNKADAYRRQLKKKAPGVPAATVTMNVSSDTYFCDVLAGQAPIPWELAANADAPFDPSRDFTQVLQQMALIEREVEWAATFFVTGVWGTSTTPAILWSAASSTPLTDFETGIKTVLQNTGKKPNKLVLGYETWSILKNHTTILDRVNAGQTPGGAAQVLPSTLAALVGVDEVLIMESIQNTAKEGQTASMSFIGGKHALLVYAAPQPSVQLPSGGYTFVWNGIPGGGGGLGTAVESWYSRDAGAEFVRLQMAYDMKLTASDLGYAFINAVA